jgi:hypothetical protein
MNNSLRGSVGNDNKLRNDNECRRSCSIDAARRLRILCEGGLHVLKRLSCQIRLTNRNY